jgi:hypothetical protein
MPKLQTHLLNCLKLFVLLALGLFVMAFSIYPEGTTATPLPQLRLVVPAQNVPLDLSAVEDAINDRLRLELGLTVRLEMVSVADYSAHMTNLNQRGDAYDLAFTSAELNPYNENVANGYLRPLDDLLAAYAPQAAKQIPTPAWEAVRREGNFYMLPSLQPAWASSCSSTCPAPDRVVAGGGLAIGTNSPAPGYAAALIGKLNTDPTLYNLFAYGVEGRHWSFRNRQLGIIGPAMGYGIGAPTYEQGGYAPNLIVVWGNVFNSYALETGQ